MPPGTPIGMVVAFRDISDALKAQEERARAGKLASLGLLAGGIAHDFNNILMAIMGNVSMARVSMPADGAAALALTEAEKACIHARQLTWQLLTFSKGGVPVKKTIALPQILQECASLALRGTPVTCTFESIRISWAVHADAAQLTQVFSNILINAQQAMPNGGVIQVTASERVETAKRFEYALPVEAGPYVRISVTDTGIGIPDENLGSIFDPVLQHQAEGQRPRPRDLAFDCQEPRRVRHRRIEARMRHDHRRQPAGAARRRRRRPPRNGSRSRQHGGRGRILVMDDEPAVRTVAVNMLQLPRARSGRRRIGHAAIEHYRRA